VEFEWDLAKEIENLQKHRISFVEAVETFSDPLGFQLADSKHSVVLLGGQIGFREDTHN